MCHICKAVEQLEEQEEITNLKAKLNDAQDLLENCGYCRECLWDMESIHDVSTSLTEAVWPDDCTPICEGCNREFVNMVKRRLENGTN